MGQVIQFPAARRGRQAKAPSPARTATSSGVLGAWFAMIEIHLRAWRTFGHSLAPSKQTAESEREAVGSK